MHLSDCRQDFLRQLSPESHRLTAHLEAEARSIRDLVARAADSPSENDCARTRQFLVDVELWKADCMEDLTGNALRNSPRETWSAIQGALTARDDRVALLSIMALVGFGSSRDEHTGLRRAKRATAVLRFLDPDQWGTIDWRTTAILSFYKKADLDIGFALEQARRHSIGKIASDFDLIDEEAALQIEREYRKMRDERSPRTVDVELALYGASFLAWPRPDKRSRQRARRQPL